jgi:hypothetical protein
MMFRQVLPSVAAAIATFAGVARAGTEHERERESVRVERDCGMFRGVPKDATSAKLVWDQQLSLAACATAVDVAPVSDPAQLPAMVAQLEDAYSGAIDAARDAQSLAPPQLRIVGAFALASAHLAIVVRARAAIEIPRDAPDYLARLHAMHRVLEPLLASDLRAARASFDEVGYLGEDYPQARDAVTATLVSRARTTCAELAATP